MFSLNLCLAFITSVVIGSRSNIETTRRTDRRFITSTLPYCPSVSYTQQEWDDWIGQNVDISNIDKVRQKVEQQLRYFGVDIRSGVARNDGSIITLNLDNISGISKAILTLYTLGRPHHTGYLFYPYFNWLTKETIQKSRPIGNYVYALNYGLMDHAYNENSKTVEGPLYHRADGHFNACEGNLFRFNQFTATKANMSVGTGLNFLVPNVTLFVIFRAPALDMSGVSQFTDEQEYLIHPFQEFVVNAKLRDKSFLNGFTDIVYLIP